MSIFAVGYFYPFIKKQSKLLVCKGTVAFHCLELVPKIYQQR